MKQPYVLAVAVRLATAREGLAEALSQTSSVQSSSSNKTISSSTPFPTGSTDPNAPVCGAGFTYCGYILRDHKNFKEEDIIKTYCDAHRDNCINGTTQTDPLQALYICLPPNASPVETWLDSSYQANKQMIAHGGTSSPDDDLEKTKPYTKPTKLLSPRARPTPHPEHKEQHLKRTHHMANLYTKTYHHHHNLLNHNGELAKQSSSEATHQPTTSSTTSAAAPFLTPLVPVSLSAAGTGTGIGTRTDTTSASSTVPRPSTPSSNSCSSSATVPNNKIELLCSCGRQCLNPMGDHIGRCDVPCSS